MSRLISEDHVIAAPEGCTKAGKAKREPYDYAERDQIPESLCLEETGESVPLDSLEDVVFGVNEDFWIISTHCFDCVYDTVEDGFWKDDLPLGSWENEGVQDFLRTGTYVGTGYCVSGRIGIGTNLRRRDEARTGGSLSRGPLDCFRLI